MSNLFLQRPPKQLVWSWGSVSVLFIRRNWLLLSVMVVCGAYSWARIIEKKRLNKQTVSYTNRRISGSKDNDPVASDPSLLKKHSSIAAYTIVSIKGYKITYPSIRTFYHPHPQAPKLPIEPTPLPLLVFIHGLGGSVAQFHPLLTSLVNVAPCLAIDLPGCGRSGFSPQNWDAYTLENLATLVGDAINHYRDAELGQEVVLVGHSMGCYLALLLASQSSTLPVAKSLAKHIRGVIAICPRAELPTEKEVALFKRLLLVPGPIFDLFRAWDKRGGTQSTSVARFVGADAEYEAKKLQVRFNEQSRTPVWRRMARGMLPDDYEDAGRVGIPGKEIWSGLNVPLMLVAGEADKVTPAIELEKIAGFLGKTTHKDPGKQMEPGQIIVDTAAPVDSNIINGSLGSSSDSNKEPERVDSISMTNAPSKATSVELNVERRPQQSNHTKPLKTTILPAPAAHGLLYAPSTARIVAGLIQSFLAAHVDERLDLGWQLQFLATEGKWDVKNVQKWQGVKTVSAPIPSPFPLDSSSKAYNSNRLGPYTPKDLGTGKIHKQIRIPIFRAMKTLREVDDVHSPSIFVKQWNGIIKAVIDISHESPVYNPHNLEEGGMEYHKFPTVSKLPPTADEVQSFISLVDRLREQLSIGGPILSSEHTQSYTDTDSLVGDGEETPVIGVHCHYGYNRTGFFVVSYMIEKLGFRPDEALDEFERQRPPGIRHAHFIDQLFVRYCVGLRRAPTL